MTVDKRAAKAAYRERKSVAGIYAWRCAATGQVWVGHTPTLERAQNRLWFTLRQKNYTDAALQRAWNDQRGGYLRYRVMMLPLSDDGVTVSHLIGMALYEF